MPIYSHSRLSSFEQCPLKYKYAYIDRVDMRLRSIEAFMGNRFHEVMEHLYEKAPLHIPQEGELLSLFNRLWDEQWTDDILIVQKDRDAGHYRNIGLKAVSDYFRRYFPFDQGRVIGIERELITDLDEGTGRYRLRCIIDRLTLLDDGIFEIHDYKTSAFLPEQQKLDGDRQLALYEIAVRSSWPAAKRVDLIWHYVAFDMEMRSQRNDIQLAALKKDLIGLIDKVEAETLFAPRESSLCPWCDFQRICPLFKNKFDTESLSLEEYAEEEGIGIVNRFASLDTEKKELTARIHAIEEKMEALKRAIVAKAEQEKVSRLFGDSHIMSIRDDLKVHYPKKGEFARAEFESAMKGLGLWEEVQDISWSALKSLAEQKGWAAQSSLPESLSSLIKIETTKQVRLAKRKDLSDKED